MSYDELARTMPVSPPTVKRKMKPRARIMAGDHLILPPWSVASQGDGNEGRNHAILRSPALHHWCCSLTPGSGERSPDSPLSQPHSVSLLPSEGGAQVPLVSTDTTSWENQSTSCFCGGRVKDLLPVCFPSGGSGEKSPINRNWLEARRKFQARLYLPPGKGPLMQHGVEGGGGWSENKQQVPLLVRRLRWGELVPYMGWGKGCIHRLGWRGGLGVLPTP